MNGVVQWGGRCWNQEGASYQSHSRPLLWPLACAVAWSRESLSTPVAPEAQCAMRQTPIRPSSSPWGDTNTVRNTQYTMHNAQYATHNAQYAMHNTQFTIRNTQYTIHNTQCTIRNTQCSAQTQRESNNASNMRSDRRAHRQPPFLQHGQGGASAEAGGIATSSPFVLSSVTAPTETVSTISSASLPGTSSLQEKEEDMISARTAPRGRGRGKG